MSKRELRSAGSTTAQTLDATKTYKLNSSGTLVESTGTPAGTDIVFTGSKSSLRRIADLERNVSILAAKALTDDGSGEGTSGYVDYAKVAGKWSSSRTITLSGDLSGNVSIDGSQNVTLSATIAANSVALGTDTTGNYVATVTAGTGISVSGSGSETAGVTVAVDTSTIATKAYVDSSVQAKDNTDEITEGATNLFFTNARARGAVSFTAGSGAYNSSTGVFTIPTNTNQLTNGAGFVTSSGVTSVATGNGLTGGTITSTGTLSMSGSYTGNFAVSGAITATGEITAYYSDKRLKENIKPIENALAKTLSLHGVTYNANDVAASFGYTNKEKQVGLLAQDVKAVLPEVIAPAPFDVKVVDGKEVSKSGEDYITVKYEKIVALLVEAIKELNDKVESLESQLGGSKSL
jgi:Chaperone of endosialidase